MVTNAELKELLVTREPVIGKTRGITAGLQDVEYAYVSGIIMRYDPKVGKYIVYAELKDKNLRCVEIMQPKYIRKVSENDNI